MAITYSNFLTQVRNYTEVSSNVLSDTLIDQFISNSEFLINANWSEYKSSPPNSSVIYSTTQ